MNLTVIKINSTNKALLALRTRSVEVNKLPRATQEKVNSAPEGHAVESEVIPNKSSL